MNLNPDELLQVLQLIRPNAQWVFDGVDLRWDDTLQPRPTDQELSDGLALLRSRVYRESRAQEYPSVGDQLDALWKGGQAAADLLAQIQAVKAKYPKP